MELNSGVTHSASPSIQIKRWTTPGRGPARISWIRRSGSNLAALQKIRNAERKIFAQRLPLSIR